MLLRKKLQQGENEEQIIANLPENNDHIANYILEHNGQLPPQPMFEKHPYLDDFELQNFEKYIIGTFPPISYIYDHHLMIQNGIGQNQLPQIPAFHGNMGSMWKYFFNEAELNELQNIVNQGHRGAARDYIYENLKNLSINYSDIIKHTRRESYNANDAGLWNINPNLDLIVHILQNPRAKYLNFNSSTLFNNPNSGFGVILKNHGQNVAGNLREESKSLNLFLVTLQKLGFKIEIALPGEAYYTINQQNAHFINNTFKLKVLVNLRISIETLKIENAVFENIEREFIVIVGASPAGAAALALAGNQIYQNWLAVQPEVVLQNQPTIKFRKVMYELFRNNNWEALQAMNVNL
jgi:hypothetical protein